MLALVLKLTLAPGLVVLANALARRLGARVGGLLSGFPVIAAPIALIYLLEQGPEFATQAAGAAILGMVPSTIFSVTFACLAIRAPVLVSLTASSAAYVLTLMGATLIEPSIVVSTVLAAFAIATGSAILKRLPRIAATAVATRSDLLIWRIVLTVALVMALTSAAAGLSPHVAGLLAPVPIITAVMAGFTQVRSGSAAVCDLLQGLVLAYFSFLTFFVVLAFALTQVGPGVSFAAATGGALLAWCFLIVATRRNASGSAGVGR